MHSHNFDFTGPLHARRPWLTWPLLLLMLLVNGCKKTVINESVSGSGAVNPPGETLPDPGVDTDGDGLDDRDELLGYDIAVDEQGYGNPSTRRVTSNPALADSDGDGLLDQNEFIRRTDPSRTDSDGDGLSDFEEINRWKTNPTSVDTDGDSRGQAGTLAPNQELFDGLELMNSGTSPTLADTDGDGQSDFVELNSSSRSALIAELPQAQVEFSGNLDMFLNVEYEETLGVTEDYGSSISTENSTTSSVSYENSISTEVGVAVEVKVSADVTIPPGVSGETTVAGHVDVTYGHTWSESQETSKTMGTEYSRFVSDSKSMTEAFASGTVTLGVEVENVGQSAFGVDDLALTLLLFAPGASGDSREFRTLATLQSTTMSLVLSPGERSAVIRFSADDVNPDLMKEFLANPSSMVLRPTSFGLTNASGVDFDFITQTTASQTALVEIKFGPEDFQTYRVATNVQRTASGALAGVRMADVMETLGYTLGSGYSTQEQFTTDSSGNKVSNGLVLTGLAGRAFQMDNGFPVAFWSVNRKSADGARIGGALPNFDDITLLPGEEIQLTYVLDLDKDGLSDSLESFFATASGITDTDADGLDDYEEVITGIMAGADSMGNAMMGLQAYGYPKRVFTNPRLADSDFDGLSDAAEKALGSDPIHPDTDRDGILDGPDPCPLSASRTLFVNSDPAFGSPTGPGASWGTAYLHLQDALSAARLANGNADCADDVGEIWVARGVYKADGGIGANRGSLLKNASFVLDMDIEIYGGFSGLGFELKREQRDSNPASNGTELSGDLMNDDSLGANRSDNTNTIVVTGQKSVVTLDGFTISGGENVKASGGGLLANDCTGNWRNINFFDNSSVVSGGAVFIGLGTNRMEECSFTMNSGGLGGGALDANAPGLLEIVDCTFTDNIAVQGFGGGAVLVTNGGDLLIDQCVFTGNKADISEGGAIYARGARMMISKCMFQANTAKLRGGAISSRANASVNVVNCRIASNELFDGDSRGSGLYNERRAGAQMNVINCTIDGNRSNTSGVETFVAYPHGALYGATKVVNCLIFNNDRITGWDGHGNGSASCGTNKVGGFALANDQVAQINDVLDGAVNHCFIQNLGVRIELGLWTYCSNDATWNPYQGDNNLGFATYTDSTNRTQGGSPITATGELMDGSIGIDAGTNTVDIDLNTPGTQFLPPADLDGKPRQVDGDADGTSIVDTGAFEYQGS